MTKPARSTRPRRDRTDESLPLFVEALLDDYFSDADCRERYEILARGGRGTGFKAGDTVSIVTLALSDGGEVGLTLRVGSPGITVAITHARFSVAVFTRYDPETALMTEARVTQVKGDREKLRQRIERWFGELFTPSSDDDGGDQDLDAAMAALLAGDDSPFAKEEDPGEPPPPSTEDKAMVEALARTLGREMKRKKPDMMRHEDEVRALEESPQSLWPILDGLVDASTASPPDEFLIEAWRFLLEAQLTLIRYRIDSGWDWAKRMADEYQRKLIEIGHQGRIPPEAFAAMMGALGEAGIKVTPEARTALAESGLTLPEPMPSAELQGLMHGLIDQMASAVSTPFEVAAGLGEATQVMPTELQSYMAHEFALSSHPVLRDTMPLMLLAEDQDVRRVAAAALEQTAAPDTMSPEALRRMIAVRNWVPEADRPQIDRAIRQARLKNVGCAQWPAARALTITASMIDGSGAQSLILTSPTGRKGILAGLLFRSAVGVADSWCDTSATRRDIGEALAAQNEAGPASQIDRDYLDAVVNHAIAIGVSTGRPPGHVLLAIAELAGGNEWRDRRLDVAAEANRLFDSLPDEQRSPAGIAASLDRSGGWIHEDFADSWFLEGPEIRAIVRHGPGRGIARAAQRLVAEAMPKRRAEWAERFLLLGLRACAAKDRTEKARANDFIILAHALCGDRGLDAIPLMVAIARHTAEVVQLARW